MAILRETKTRTAFGSELLLKGLMEQEVEIIFSYPGGAVLPLYDALYDAEIPNILTRHEQELSMRLKAMPRPQGNRES